MISFQVAFTLSMIFAREALLAIPRTRYAGNHLSIVFDLPVDFAPKVKLYIRVSHVRIKVHLSQM